MIEQLCKGENGTKGKSPSAGSQPWLWPRDYFKKGRERKTLMQRSRSFEGVCHIPKREARGYSRQGRRKGAVAKRKKGGEKRGTKLGRGWAESGRAVTPVLSSHPIPAAWVVVAHAQSGPPYQEVPNQPPRFRAIWPSHPQSIPSPRAATEQEPGSASPRLGSNHSTPSCPQRHSPRSGGRTILCMHAGMHLIGNEGPQQAEVISS